MNNYPTKKTILLTGGAGFIGSNLTKKLLSLGNRVIVIDNFVSGREVNIDEFLNDKNYQLINANVSQEVGNYLPTDIKLDLILHFASPASPPKYQEKPVETYLVNSLATHYLLSYIKKTNPNIRFVFASTSETYGDPKIHPQTENYWGNVNPNGKRSCYDESKRLGETICGVFNRDFGIDARILRIFNTYGPNMDPTDGRVIPNLITQALENKPLTIYGDGSQTRSYCYIDDLIEYILRMSARDNLAGETINIGNPGEYTVMQTAQIINKLISSSSELKIENKPIPADDPVRRQPDITKAKSLLEYEPQVSFKEGLKSTIEYFKDELESFY